MANRVKKGQLKQGTDQTYFIKGKKGLYVFLGSGLNPQTKKIEYTMMNIESQRQVEVTAQDLVNGCVLYGLSKNDLCTYNNEPVQFEGKDKGYFIFKTEDGKTIKKRFDDLAKDDSDLTFGYSEKKKTRTVKKKEQKHEVDDFGKEVLGARKNHERYRKMTTEQLKQLPQEQKINAAQKTVLYETPDFASMTDRKCRILKQEIWNRIPDNPSVIAGVAVEGILDDYFEFVRTVWGEMAEPKNTYNEFNSDQWLQDLEDALFMENGMSIAPFNYFNLDKIAKLHELMPPNDQELEQFAIDNGRDFDKDNRWKRFFSIIPIAKGIFDNDVVYIKEPKGSKRYLIPQKMLAEGIPEDTTWLVADRRLHCPKGKEGGTPNGIIAIGVATKEEAWKKAQEYYAVNAKRSKTKKARLLIEMDKCERIPMQGIPVRDPNRNITEKEFEKVFGTWGGVFGKSQSDPIRHEYLNQTFDGLQDMFYALGLPATKDLCFGNTLSIGFGSHGAGANEATFKPDKNNVINFTTERGYGHLGRMWFIALDHIAGMRLGFGKSMTAQYELNIGRTPAPIRNLLDYLIYGEDTTRRRRRSRYFTDAVGLRTRYIGYYTEPKDLFARAGSGYLIDKFEAKNMKNDFVNGKSDYKTPEGYYLTPQGTEREKIDALFDNLMSYLQEQDVFKSSGE